VARRGLREEEIAMWGAAMRGVKPLREVAPEKVRGRGVVPAAPKGGQAGDGVAEAGRPEVVVRAVPARAAASWGKGPPVGVGIRSPGLDDTSWRALSRGKMRVQRRLDLHGHVAQDAFERLHRFLLRASAEGVRCVEIVTGLGSGVEGGVLRRELPHWLSRPDLHPLILALVHPHARNQGSVRILLRRRDRGMR